MTPVVKTIRVYLNDDRHGVITCPNCGVKRTVNMSQYQGNLRGKSLKVKCDACATVFDVRFDFRRHHRVKVHLPAKLLRVYTRNVLAHITVKSLSMGGIAFTTSEDVPLQLGESYDIIFFLDDKNRSLIFEEVVIRRIQGNDVGAEWGTQDRYHYDLDFYMMGEIPDAESA